MLKLCAALMAALVGICGSAWAAEVWEEEPNDEFEAAQAIAITSNDTTVVGEITAVDDPADYFAFSGLRPNRFYSLELLVSNLALLLLDESGGVVDSRGDEFPNKFEGVRIDETGVLYLAVCSLDGMPPGQRTYDCEIGTTTVDDPPYELELLLLPEPGGKALQLAALLTLAVLSRRRA